MTHFQRASVWILAAVFFPLGLMSLGIGSGRAQGQSSLPSEPLKQQREGLKQQREALKEQREALKEKRKALKEEGKARMKELKKSGQVDPEAMKKVREEMRSEERRVGKE